MCERRNADDALVYGDLYWPHADYWKWRVYKEWERLADLHGKDAEYFAEAIKHFDRASLAGDPRAVVAAIAYFRKKLRDSERDAA